VISSRYPQPQALTDLWEHQWPGCPPMAHLLRSRYLDRWVRFHSLPGSKRYPENEGENGTLLNRHYTVLDQLEAGPVVLAITTEWTDTAELTGRFNYLLGSSRRFVMRHSAQEREPDCVLWTDSLGLERRVSPADRVSFTMARFAGHRVQPNGCRR
jgi:hypothetical protein